MLFHCDAGVSELYRGLVLDDGWVGGCWDWSEDSMGYVGFELSNVECLRLVCCFDSTLSSFVYQRAENFSHKVTILFEALVVIGTNPYD